MLGFLFGFNARLGRLHYFLATIGLGVVMTGLCFVLAPTIYRSMPRGVPLSFAHMGWPVIALTVFFMFGTISLQCMRIRDIGWDPVCVVPAWITILIIDRLVAAKFPALLLGSEHHATAVGGLINLGMMLALLFWPGTDHVATPPDIDPPRQADPPSRRGGEGLAASRIARVSGAEFGRRAG